MTQLIQMSDWRHDPRRRKHRFRCQGCQRLIEDGSDIVLEKRGKASHGYHAGCFDATKYQPFSMANGALLRDWRRRHPA